MTAQAQAQKLLRLRMRYLAASPFGFRPGGTLIYFRGRGESTKSKRGLQPCLGQHQQKKMKGKDEQRQRATPAAIHLDLRDSSELQVFRGLGLFSRGSKE